MLDKFHFKKRTRSLFSGDICKGYGLIAHSSIMKDDKLLFGKIITNMINEVKEKMPESISKKNKLKKIREHKKFILKHWKAIQNSELAGSIGSCTEAMVSHVLSERFSRNPMGWSKAGLSKMAMIRMFVLNGDKVMPGDTSMWKNSGKRNIVVNEFSKYKNIVKCQNDEIFKDVKSWR